MPEIKEVANYHCITGENPLWNERDGRIYWEDIETGRLFRARHGSSEHQCFYKGERVGGFTFQADGSLLLFEVDRISRLDENGTHTVLRSGIDADMARFNDVMADPEGRIFAGTIGKTDENGGLYRVDLDGRISSIWKGTGCANGMGFTPDLRALYWTCSTTRQLYVADYDRATGELSGRRLFYAAAPDEGTPDGMTVDEAGDVWTTRWDGGAFYRMSTEAKIRERIAMPVSKVSSITFGGPNLDVAYVTTAGGTGTDAGGAEGTLYSVTGLGVRGRPEFRSKIRF